MPFSVGGITITPFRSPGQGACPGVTGSISLGAWQRQPGIPNAAWSTSSASRRVTVHISLAPPDYDTTLGPLPEGVILVRLLRGQFDFIQFFTDRRANLERVFPSPQEGAEEGRYVVCVVAEEGVGRVHGRDRRRSAHIALGNGQVDVKVAAVDEAQADCIASSS